MSCQLAYANNFLKSRYVSDITQWLQKNHAPGRFRTVAVRFPAATTASTCRTNRDAFTKVAFAATMLRSCRQAVQVIALL